MDFSPGKNNMKKLDRNECYCAFCRTPRRIYTKRHVSLIDILSAFFLSALTMYFIWQSFNPRALLFVAMYVSVMEVFIGVRWRIMIVCRHCGFDPVLYVKDPSAAAEKVRAFLEHRKSSSDFMFSPPLDLPVQKATPPVPVAPTKGTRVSKVI